MISFVLTFTNSFHAFINNAAGPRRRSNRNPSSNLVNVAGLASSSSISSSSVGGGGEGDSMRELRAELEDALRIGQERLDRIEQLEEQNMQQVNYSFEIGRLIQILRIHSSLYIYGLPSLIISGISITSDPVSFKECSRSY